MTQRLRGSTSENYHDTNRESVLQAESEESERKIFWNQHIWVDSLLTQALFSITIDLLGVREKQQVHSILW